MNRNIPRALLNDREIKSLYEMKQRVMENATLRAILKEGGATLEVVGGDIVEAIDRMIDFRTKQILNHGTPGNENLEYQFLYKDNTPT